MPKIKIGDSVIYINSQKKGIIKNYFHLQEDVDLYYDMIDNQIINFL